jgi:uracil phosphoribosyltransferase
MKVINLSERSSLLNQYLKEIRSVDIQKDSMRFRRNIERIGEVMALEVSRELDYQPENVQTPLGVASVQIAQDQIVVASVMRAGLPLHTGFLNMYDHAENAFLSAYRRINDKGELEIVSEYLAAPKLDGKTLLLVDPMLATGMSMEAAYQALLTHGKPKHVHLCCVIGTHQSVAYLQNIMPDNVTLWCAAIDPVLNEKKYIVPGLGDAGDLCFGEKL